MLEFPEIGGSTLAARLDPSLSATPLLLCYSGLRHDLLRLSRCPRSTSSISCLIRIFHTALVLTSFWAVSNFSLHYSSTRSPQPTSRTSPSPTQPTTTISPRPARSWVPHFSPRTAPCSPDSRMKTRSIKAALKTEKASSPNGAPHQTGENVRITLRPSDLLSPSRSAPNKPNGSAPSGTPSFVLLPMRVRRIRNLGDGGEFVFGVEGVVVRPNCVSPRYPRLFEFRGRTPLAFLRLHGEW